MIRKKILNSLVLALLLVYSGVDVQGQCNYQLVESAAQEAGSNTVYLRDFKVRLADASIDDPVPTGKFPVYLNKGVNYRFTVANSAENNGKALVDLIRRGQVYAANYSTDGYATSFDFVCEKAATYQMQISFGEGGEGCAAVVMSLILQDTLNYIEPGVPLKSDSLETLHLWIENEIQIATTLQGNYNFDVFVSQGEIVKKGAFYIVKPAEEGELDITVHVLNEAGDIVEGDTVTYFVDKPPLPVLTLPKERVAAISEKDFVGSDEVKLEYFVAHTEDLYLLKRFTIARTEMAVNGLISYDSRLTMEQAEFIRGLKAGDTFYITDIQMVDPDGVAHTAASRRIYITE